MADEPVPEDAAAEGEGEGGEAAPGDDEAMKEVEDMVEDAANEIKAVLDDNPDLKETLEKSLVEIKEAMKHKGSKLEDLVNAGALVPSKGPPAAGGDVMQFSPSTESKVIKELAEAERQAQQTAKIINELKERVNALLNTPHMTEDESKELEEKNELLAKHLQDFENRTKQVQYLVGLADGKIMSSMKDAGKSVKSKGEEAMLPKVIICGMTEDNMPKIIICDGDKKRKKSKSPTGIAKRLSESYNMQEKLANENADLEGKRYKLSEELINKDQTVEVLQRKLDSVQAELKLVVKENTILNSKLEQYTGGKMACGQCPETGIRTVCPADVELRLQNYSNTTTVLEKQLGQMENEVRHMQNELQSVQRERQMLEQKKKTACRAPCSMGGGGGLGGAPDTQTRELREQYQRLQDDFKAKVSEVAQLKAYNEELKRAAQDAEHDRDEARRKFQELESKQRDAPGSGRRSAPQTGPDLEQQVTTAKQRAREALDELEEVRQLLQEQATQLEDYRYKYLTAQQQVEEQRRQIDMMELDNSRVNEQVAIEITRIKNQFQEKLAELSPLPDILKETQKKFHEAQQLAMMHERNNDKVSRELQYYKEKLNTVMAQVKKAESNHSNGNNEKDMLEKKIASAEGKYNDLKKDFDRLKQDSARNEETIKQYEKRLDEKMFEVSQINSQLEMVREESARQVSRAKERNETIRRSLMNQIADLERQLAQSRALAKSAQKERDDIRQRMQSQICSLNENFEQAQLRIRSLQGHVNFLKSSYTNVVSSPLGGDMADECDCASIFPPGGADALSKPKADDGCDCGQDFC